MKYLIHLLCFKDHVIPVSFQACSLVVEMMVIFCISTPNSNGNCLLKPYWKKDRNDGKTRKDM